MPRPAVTICIPAYQSEAFIEETINSALAQSWPIELAISIDRGLDGTAELVRRLSSRPRTRMVEQSRRLGWIGNANAALAMARSEFAMLLPHDDVLQPGYVAACMEALASDVHASLAYSDITFIGRPDSLAVEPSVVGPPTARLAAIAQHHLDAVAFRGVFSRQRARSSAIPSFPIGGFAADTLWVARMAGQGSILRVPGGLYRKRLLPSSAHRRWHGATAGEVDEMWVVHCLELLRLVAAARPGILWDAAFRAAFRSRLMREHVHFRKRSGLPQQLDGGRPLLPQMLAVYAGVALRTPHYSWM